jgi:hypothetical protein
MKQVAAELAWWEDEELEFIREKVIEEGKCEVLKKGKAPEQVFDESIFTYFLDDSTAIAALVHYRWFLMGLHFLWI